LSICTSLLLLLLLLLLLTHLLLRLCAVAGPHQVGAENRRWWPGRRRSR
jgi:hypothetical protein